jgi:hypothetical protein
MSHQVLRGLQSIANPGPLFYLRNGGISGRRADCGEILENKWRRDEGDTYDKGDSSREGFPIEGEDLSIEEKLREWKEKALISYLRITMNSVSYLLLSCTARAFISLIL